MPHQGCFSASLAVMRLAGSSVSRRLSRSKPASERPPRVSRALGAGNLVRSRLYGCCGNLICSRRVQLFRRSSQHGCSVCAMWPRNKLASQQCPHPACEHCSAHSCPFCPNAAAGVRAAAHGMPHLGGGGQFGEPRPDLLVGGAQQAEDPADLVQLAAAVKQHLQRQRRRLLFSFWKIDAWTQGAGGGLAC